MPKVPLPTKIPESISPTLWQNVNRRDILSFLSDHGGTYLFYSVMKNDPDPHNSTIEHVNAAKVDKILNLQKAQFLAQAESMYLDTKTNSPVKKNPTTTVGDEEEIEAAFEGKEGVDTITDTISFHKLPSGVYGHKDLQKGLYNLLTSMGQTNYSATVSAVEPTPQTAAPSSSRCSTTRSRLNPVRRTNRQRTPTSTIGIPSPTIPTSYLGGLRSYCCKRQRQRLASQTVPA